MLDLQRHSQCPIWENATKLTGNTTTKNGAVNNNEKENHANTGDGISWPGLEYACLKIFQTYCKIFNQEEIYDLIVRYEEFLFIYYLYFFND